MHDAGERDEVTVDALVVFGLGDAGLEHRARKTVMVSSRKPGLG